MVDLATKADLQATKADLRTVEKNLQTAIANFEGNKQRALAHFETVLLLRLTLRFGIMLAVWVALALIFLKPLANQ